MGFFYGVLVTPHFFLNEIGVALIFVNERSGVSPYVRRQGPTRLDWHMSSGCDFVVLSLFNLLSFEFSVFFGAFVGLRTSAQAGILDLPSFPLSTPPDARTRGPDPLEPFLDFRTLLSGLCCLGATWGRHPDSER